MLTWPSQRGRRTCNGRKLKDTWPFVVVEQILFDPATLGFAAHGESANCGCAVATQALLFVVINETL
jgi:hypothetical protein